MAKRKTTTKKTTKTTARKSNVIAEVNYDYPVVHSQRKFIGTEGTDSISTMLRESRKNGVVESYWGFAEITVSGVTIKLNVAYGGGDDVWDSEDGGVETIRDIIDTLTAFVHEVDSTENFIAEKGTTTTTDFFSDSP